MSHVQIASSVRAAIAAMEDRSDPADGAQTLSAVYRRQIGRAVTLGEAGKRSYLAVRMPGTYAAVARSLALAGAAGADDFESLLDAGCGPGTASLAAAEIWPSLTQVTRSDIDGTWRPIAETLGTASGNQPLARGRWLTGAMDAIAYPIHDAVIAAYALNEVPHSHRAAVVRTLWAAAAKALFLVEPGTPQGFLNIVAARTELLALGAQIAAPCPHHDACPMSESDWCHSAVRLLRDPLHRAAKGGQLPFEDEKFAYLAATRFSAARRPLARIVKRPVAHTGHLTLDLCGSDGLTRRTISRRDGALYKAARKADWGDGWPPD